MAISTFLFWPLPLLHGRKPYTLVALGITLPLQFPQAVMVMERRFGDNSKYMTGLLLSRGLSGLALGFAHINFRSTLLDLFGASLQSTHPHGEIVVVDDVRRHGGGMGLWLGTWSFCSIGSIALGFLIGAEIVSGLNVAWGFYITVILIACTLFLNVLAPETRRSAHRRTMAEVELPNMSISRRVARGEIKMHVSGDGPKWWWEEVFAGVYLTAKMLDQPGFGLMALYLGWVYGEIVLVIVVSLFIRCCISRTNSVAASWQPSISTIPMETCICGAGSLLDRHWSLPCYSQYEGEFSQQVEVSPLPDRQHDFPTEDYVDFTHGSQSGVHDHIAAGGHRIHPRFCWKVCAIHGSDRLRWPHWLRLQSCDL